VRREVDEARWFWRWALPTALLAGIGALGYFLGASLP
jgi:hypothetical protein